MLNFENMNSMKRIMSTQYGGLSAGMLSMVALVISVLAILGVGSVYFFSDSVTQVNRGHDELVKSTTAKFADIERRLDTRIDTSSFALKSDLLEAMGGDRVDITKEEYDAFLVAITANADRIDMLNKERGAVDFSAIDTQISAMNNNLNSLRSSVVDQKALIKKLSDGADVNTKNIGWLQNRVSKLEGGGTTRTPTKSKAKSKPKAVASNTIENKVVSKLEVSREWKVIAPGKNKAVIQNLTNTDRLIASRGLDIPGCGKIIDITLQAVTTEKCIIEPTI